MDYTELLLRVRARSFVASNWPDEVFAETEPPPDLKAEAHSAHSCWMKFEKDHEPQIVGLLLSDVSVEDPVFVAVLAYPDGRVRRALWHYTCKRGWRSLGGDGAWTP